MNVNVGQEKGEFKKIKINRPIWPIVTNTQSQIFFDIGTDTRSKYWIGNYLFSKATRSRSRGMKVPQVADLCPGPLP